MKNAKFIFLTLFTGILFLVSSCSNDDEPEQGHDHDEITLLRVIVTDEDGNEVGTYDIDNEHHDDHDDHDHAKSDDDEDDHDDEHEDEVEITLDANTTYSVELQFWNNENPEDPENLTEEILEEKDEHFITFSKESDVNVTVERTDEASSTRLDGNKIGIFTSWATGDASDEGHVEIKLYHTPTGVSSVVIGDGNDFGSVDEGSETDIEVELSLTVE